MQLYSPARPQVHEYFLSRFHSFAVRSTQYSATYVADKFRVTLCERAMGFPVLGLMTKIKAEARKHTAPEVTMSYFAAKDIEPGEREVFEYDKTAAYASAAHRLGFISGDSFDRLIQLPKRFRLACLGALGTRTFVEHYESGKRLGATTEVNGQLLRIWRVIVASVSEEMSGHFLRNRECFAYWVDALYAFEPMELPEEFKASRYKAQLTDSIHYVTIKKANVLYIPKSREYHYRAGFSLTGNSVALPATR